ncbi:MAG: TIGR00300 family protein [Bacteroidetes bacterium]|nr:TIGR00300 family protein [Bacteroidota bacterium]MCL5026134.1 TIGR00300 family protein [Chloroflexota bacterium]
MEQRKISRTVEVTGHLIDSWILPKILDDLIDLGTEFVIHRLEVGRGKTDRSYARIEILARDEATLEAALEDMRRLGATPVDVDEVRVDAAPADGVFPEGFYATTNLPTSVRINGDWVPVRFPEMDCGILVEGETARTIAMNEVRKGELIVVGHSGVKVEPQERPRVPTSTFRFMGSSVSSEKPKALAMQEIAEHVRDAKARGGKVLVVAGPAVIHVGARDHLCQLIAGGQVDYLFAGNGLATHDIEMALYGTSLGIPLAGGMPPDTGHEHHLRAINRIRAAGGIRPAVESGLVDSGVMYSCVKHGVQYVLAGSIRDDGPLPDVITDTMQAQAAMRSCIRDGVTVALMLSTMLHSIAVGNILPANVYTVCVDINPGTLTKLVDRGSHQTVGLVMDVGSFLQDLAHALLARPALNIVREEE